MLLSIDTSTRYAGVALSGDAGVLSTRCWFSTLNHTAELMPAVSALLRERGATPADLTGVSVALGPGGFSALRVGVSAAKGLALALGVPLVGVGTLDLEAFPFVGSGLPVCPWLDAGRKEVAAAWFNADGQSSREDLICPPEELLDSITEQTVICGEGVLRWAGLIEEKLRALAVLVSPNPMARTWSLAQLGSRRLASGEVDDLAGLQPYYLRMPSIGVPKRRDWVPQRP